MRNILIIQGDWENGMVRLALDLKDEGHKVSKVIFCLPDYLYRIKGLATHTYGKPLAEFRDWLRELAKEHEYNCFFLYNHHRPYNQIAWNLASDLGLECQVFELGLIRPNCMTVFSRDCLPLHHLKEQWQMALNRKASVPEPLPKELQTVSTPKKMTKFAFNYVISRLTAFLFPHFVDQREMSLRKHLKHAIIHAWRYALRSDEARYNDLFVGEWSGKYYAVPLQVQSDTQISHYSDYESVEAFIAEIAESFIRHAPADTKLIFKIHPMDRGYGDYIDMVADLCDRLGPGRFIHLDRVHLPTMLAHARGLVTVNSSVGISALAHRRPIQVMGQAAYDLPGLTHQEGLDAFWKQAEGPSSCNVDRFIALLLETSQGRGTLSQRCFDVPGRCRIRWPKPFQETFFGACSGGEG